MVYAIVLLLAKHDSCNPQVNCFTLISWITSLRFPFPAAKLMSAVDS